MSLTAIVFWLCYVGGLVAAVRRPIVGVALYIVVYHVNPETQWWGATAHQVGLRTVLTVALATTLGLIVQRPRLGPGARVFRAPYALGLVLLALAAGSVLWGFGANDHSLFLLEKFAKVLIFAFLLIRCVRGPEDYHWVLGAWLVGVSYIGYQAWGGVGLFRHGRLTSGLGGSDFAESSDLSVHLVATLPLCGAMFFMARRHWQRLAVLAAGAFTVNTLVLTRTRNALPGLAVMLALAVWSLPRGYRLRAYLGLAVGFALAYQLVDPYWFDRMQTITEYREDGSAMGRLNYWDAAVRMAQDHPLGITIGRFHDVVREYLPELQVNRATHSTFFTALAELGYPGALVLIAIVLSSFYALHRVIGRSNRTPVIVPLGRAWSRHDFHLGWHAVALRCALAGYFAAAIFTSRLWSTDFWMLLAMTCSLLNVEKQVRAAPLTPPRAEAAPAASASGSLPTLAKGPA